MIRPMLLLAAWLSVVVMHLGLPVYQAPSASETIAIERWARAVLSHEPGQSDEAVRYLDEWTRDVRDRLPEAIELFQSVLSGRGATTPRLSLEQQRISDLAAQLNREVGAATFLRKASVLHLDAGMFGGQPEPAGAAGAVAGRTGKLAIQQSKGGFVVAADAAEIGLVAENWHFRFGRELVNRLLRLERQSRFVPRWHHAAAAFLMATGRQVQAQNHLTAALAALPDDPDLLFDAACHTEVLGLPLSQQLLSNEELLARRLATLSNQRPLANAPSRGVFTRIPLAEEANREAERGYRELLRKAPGYAEARIRLARLLIETRRAGQALEELRQVDGLSESGDGALRYYQLMFSARASQMLGEGEAAAKYYAAALQSFPLAQSARIGASRIAASRGSVSAAREFLMVLDAGSFQTGADDPWWTYHFCAGRNVNTLVMRVYASLSEPPTSLSTTRSTKD